ncbi:hypothetical protein ES707_21544 [subsurface metagenome]
MGYVAKSPFLRMHSLSNCGILRWQSERIPSDWMDHVEALHHLIAGNHIPDRVISDLAHVDGPRRVGVHFEAVIF